jgi:hypothetical protein
MLNFGRQFIYTNLVSVDAFVGIGIGNKSVVSTKSNVASYSATYSEFYNKIPNFGFNTSNKIETFAISYQVGLKFGILLNK